MGAFGTTGSGATVSVDELSDEELVGLYHEGVHEALPTLLDRFRGLARLKARSYFLPGGDEQDVVQEAMIGLYKAIKDFDGRRHTRFRTFADICISRQLVSVLKTANRLKHAPLNRSVRLSVVVGDGEDALETRLAAPQSDPAELVASREAYADMRLAFAEVLSDFESDVLHLYVEGKGYREIADELGRSTKAVDNALHRIKRKVELHLQDRDAAPDEPTPRPPRVPLQAMRAGGVRSRAAEGQPGPG